MKSLWSKVWPLYLASAVAGALVFGVKSYAESAPSTLEAPEKSCRCGPRWWPVEHVRTIDGDTFVLDIDLGWRMTLDNERIQLEGIDTPELYRGNDKARGRQAKEFVDEWLKANAPLVFLSAGDERDKYGRLLGDVCRADYGNCVVQAILDEGLEK